MCVCMAVTSVKGGRLCSMALACCVVQHLILGLDSVRPMTNDPVTAKLRPVDVDVPLRREVMVGT